MKVTPIEIENILYLLAETPQRIAAASSDLDNAQINLKLAEKSWSVNEILAHLRACADVWGDTIPYHLQPGPADGSS